jgi:hypothetical protein
MGWADARLRQAGGGWIDLRAACGELGLAWDRLEWLRAEGLRWARRRELAR